VGLFLAPVSAGRNINQRIHSPCNLDHFAAIKILAILKCAIADDSKKLISDPDLALLKF
jgi:hypothetical protein